MPRPLTSELAEKAQLALVGKKRCRKCQEVFPLGTFGIQSRADDGLQPWCKPCTNARNRAQSKVAYQADPEAARARGRAEYHRGKLRSPEKHARRVKANNLRQYGLTVEDFEALLVSQKNQCAICSATLFRGRSLHVDHSHQTGQVRALLCGGCNVGLGAFRDSPELLEKAAKYLRSFL